MGALSFPTAFETHVMVRLLLALLLGGAIGLERESQGRPAGLRTHILVCLGATIIMLASQSMAILSQDLAPTARVSVDPGRIAAGIVTGIGFLGAGAILRIGDLVRGLTTAGCIWFVAGLGIVIGQGLYSLAVVATAVILVALLALTRVERRMRPSVYRSISVATTPGNLRDVDQRCRTTLAERDIAVQDVLTQLSPADGKAELTFKIRVKQLLQSPETVQALAALTGVSDVRWA
jgi:putative Mg2+ transporter-C (MgtC) family protein